VGGLLSFFGALTYAELGAMKPQAGGEYVYVRDAYGPAGRVSLRLDVVRDRETRLPWATIATGLVFAFWDTFSIFFFFF